jgi:hypothetical protein
VPVCKRGELEGETTICSRPKAGLREAKSLAVTAPSVTWTSRSKRA